MQTQRDLAEQHQHLLKTRLQFRSQDADPNTPAFIDHYIDQAISMADCLQHVGKPQQQEALLFSVFNDLLDVIADPLPSRVFRNNCLDRLYRPLSCLNRFYEGSAGGKASLRKLHWEMQLITHYFSP